MKKILILTLRNNNEIPDYDQDVVDYIDQAMKAHQPKG